MNKFLSIIAAILASQTVHAAQLDRNLQAVILSPSYAVAAASATVAVKKVGLSYVATLGETSVVPGEGPAYYYNIPVSAVKVPLSPVQPEYVGDIVAALRFEPNAPVPQVDGVYFKPAAKP